MPLAFELDDQEYTVRNHHDQMYQVYWRSGDREKLLGGFITESTNEETLREQAEIVIEENR